ncbi:MULTISPECIES: ATP-binding protein [Streptomyces]|uniref:ATPase n=1 Tax=Streptomyces lasiicapitis TaxID=1923961 RepID=A0ABQ2LTR4_9ACTN|nr:MULTISPECIES: ATP-binding protein [Streptomyces]QIB44635.1 ATP-binding protein [Streptomyces aureoverticillatus]GGO43033.1 ATPase [Streptomyces lasiicapitis]
MPESTDTGDEPTPTPAPTPAPSPWQYTLHIPNDLRAVAICRRTLGVILAAHGLPHLSEAAELVATELVANAVTHTKGPAALRLLWADSVLRIEVWDADPTPPQPPVPPARDTLLREAGRGLALVKGCADGWGWYRPDDSELPDGEGKFVWCELAEAA